MTVRITTSILGEGYDLARAADFAKVDFDDLLAKYRLSHGQKEDGSEYSDQELWNFFAKDLVTWAVGEINIYRRKQQIRDLPVVNPVDYEIVE